MGFLTWLRERVSEVGLAWKQYKCPHDDVETMPFYNGPRKYCRKCGLVWWPKSTKGPA
jgi:hypothetical protein